MKPDQPNDRAAAPSGPLAPRVRIVQVEPTRFMELLVSRRKLERVAQHADQLVDLETREIFVRIGKPEAHFAAGA